MDSPAHYFEFIQKTYEGKMVVDIKVQYSTWGAMGRGRGEGGVVCNWCIVGILFYVHVQWKQPNSEGFVEMDFRTFAMAAKRECTHNL